MLFSSFLFSTQHLPKRIEREIRRREALDHSRTSKVFSSSFSSICRSSRKEGGRGVGGRLFPFFFSRVSPFVELVDLLPLTGCGRYKHATSPLCSLPPSIPRSPRRGVNRMHETTEPGPRRAIRMRRRRRRGEKIGKAGRRVCVGWGLVGGDL